MLGKTKYIKVIFWFEIDLVKFLEEGRNWNKVHQFFLVAVLKATNLTLQGLQKKKEDLLCDPFAVDTLQVSTPNGQRYSITAPETSQPLAKTETHTLCIWKNSVIVYHKMYSTMIHRTKMDLGMIFIFESAFKEISITAAPEITTGWPLCSC